MKRTVLFCTTILLWQAAIAQKAAVTGPHMLVYKTKADYRNLVPVMLSKDKKKIVSYPDPYDVQAAAKQEPSVLHKGYLADNRGIGEHVAFLKMTYKEFAGLKQAPGMDEMLGMIVDKDPLVTLCDCGMRGAFKDPVTELNQLIDNNKLTTTCKVLKQTRSAKKHK